MATWKAEVLKLTGMETDQSEAKLNELLRRNPKSFGAVWKEVRSEERQLRGGAFY